MIQKYYKTWLDILLPFALSRVLIFSIIFFVSQTHIVRHQAWEGEVISPHVELGTREISTYLASKLKAGDVIWYLGIVEHGYDFSNLSIEKMRNWVFFPLLPTLISFFSIFFGSTLLAGVILANTAFLIFLYTFYQYCRDEYLSDEQVNRAIWLICFFPVSYFFSLPLTESLFALFLCSSFLLLKRRKFLLSSVIFSLCILTRPTGLLVAPAFALCIWSHFNPNLRRYILYFIPSGIMLMAIMGFYFVNTSDPLAFAHNQVHWDRSGSIVSLTKKLLESPGVLLTGWNFILLNLVSTIVALISVIYFLNTRDWDYAFIILLPIAVALNTGSLLSMTRFVLPLFPFFIFLSGLTNKPANERALLAFFAVLLGIMTLLFALQVTSAMA